MNKITCKENGMGTPIDLRPPTKSVDAMSEEEKRALMASHDAGVCIRDDPDLGHVHIGAPVHGEATVPVWRVEGDHVVRYELDTADAAWLLAAER
jgi:hypothetical protein